MESKLIEQAAAYLWRELFLPVSECSSFSPEVSTGTNSLQTLHSKNH